MPKVKKWFARQLHFDQTWKPVIIHSVDRPTEISEPTGKRKALKDVQELPVTLEGAPLSRIDAALRRTDKG